MGNTENKSLAKVWVLEAGLYKQLCSLGNSAAGNPPVGTAVFWEAQGRVCSFLLKQGGFIRKYTSLLEDLCTELHPR